MNGKWFTLGSQTGPPGCWIYVTGVWVGLTSYSSTINFSVDGNMQLIADSTGAIN
jgi:hypothetical protein